MKKYKIGNVEFDSPFLLAPMAAVNCLAFRMLCKKYGAGIIYSQMINVADFVGNEKILVERYADFVEEEKPVAAQLIGATPEKMAEAAKILQTNCNIIDINFGCCERNHLGNKSGAYFIKHPDKIYDMVKRVVEAVEIPVTAKIRIGWDNQSINCVEIAKSIENAGASAIAVHPRTRKQMFQGKAKWEWIKKVKENVNIPVIGNGDVSSPELGKSMMEKTGCDYVMVGRAAIGDPHIFKRLNEFYFNKKIIDYQTITERYDDFLGFLKLYSKQKRQKFSEIRNHAIWLSKGLRNGKAMKRNIIHCEDIVQIKEIFINERRRN